MTETVSPVQAGPPPRRTWPGHVPGEAGLWVFLLGDMVVFGLFFGMIVVLRGQQPEMFAAAQQDLHTGWGALNTVVLLTSSLLVVHGVRLARERHPRAWALLAGAVGCGLLFAAVKAVEYTTLAQHGHTPDVNDFFMYYFVFTGIHLGHVVLGMGALLVGIRLARPENAGRHRETALEGVACFWHLVDLLWIVLFALLYLVA